MESRTCPALVDAANAYPTVTRTVGVVTLALDRAGTVAVATSAAPAQVAGRVAGGDGRAAAVLGGHDSRGDGDDGAGRVLRAPAPAAAEVPDGPGGADRPVGAAGAREPAQVVGGTGVDTGWRPHVPCRHSSACTARTHCCPTRPESRPRPPGPCRSPRPRTGRPCAGWSSSSYRWRSVPSTTTRRPGRRDRRRRRCPAAGDVGDVAQVPVGRRPPEYEVTAVSVSEPHTPARWAGGDDPGCPVPPTTTTFLVFLPAMP